MWKLNVSTKELIETITDDEILFIKLGLMKDNKPRLAYSRSFFFDNHLMGLDSETIYDLLKRLFEYWQNYDEYIVLEKEITKKGLDGAPMTQIGRIAIKASKRGNDVYLWRLNKKLKAFSTSFKKQILFEDRGNIKQTNAVMVTLTCDTNKFTIYNAWKTIGYRFNKWITRMRKEYGKISYIRVWEASKKAYPHIHLIMWFHDKKLTAFRHNSKWRIDEKSKFEKSWDSFVDVFAFTTLWKCFKYILKYLGKNNNLTMELCWLLKKQSYAISGDLIEQMRNSNLLNVEEEEFNEKIIEYTFVGIFSREDIGYLKHEWNFMLDRDQNRNISELIRPKSMGGMY